MFKYKWTIIKWLLIVIFALFALTVLAPIALVWTLLGWALSVILALLMIPLSFIGTIIKLIWDYICKKSDAE